MTGFTITLPGDPYPRVLYPRLGVIQADLMGARVLTASAGLRATPLHCQTSIVGQHLDMNFVSVVAFTPTPQLVCEFVPMVVCITS